MDEQYYILKVNLFKDHSILAFPKFGTIGIGFALEDDWNCNLPISCTNERIYNHIKHNKKYKEITKKDCIKAIDMIKSCLFINLGRQGLISKLETSNLYIDN